MVGRSSPRELSLSDEKAPGGNWTRHFENIHQPLHTTQLTAIPSQHRGLTFTAANSKPMAGPSNLYFNFAEAKLIHAINLLLVIERCDATRRAHRDCCYSRAALIANVPVGLLASYALYRLFRPA